VTLVDELIKAGVRLIAVKERFDINGDRDIQTKVMVTMIILFAEIERVLISERTKQGLAAAKARGRKLGRPRGSLGKSILDGKESEIVHELCYGVAKAAIARKLGVSRTSLVNFVRTRGLERASM
jgi:DNA invertase Pin-like site-specific DNA recombinase